jgi:asparagine synthase (glutamine-hydrolysing)
MLPYLAHRGPDDQGTYQDAFLALGFVRLSIIDLSPLGHQPMTSPCGNYLIIYNGEVYNYLELRTILESKGHIFRSKSDTEVVLHAFIEWGDRCLERFNGMFAFAVYDRRQRRLLIARDRFGVKPLYYAVTNGRLVFASEIRPILALMPRNQIVADEQAIFDYIAFERTDHTDRTFFSGVQRLPHAHKLLVTPNSALVPHRWYELSAELGQPFNDATEYRTALIDAVALTQRSDVPVGITLSGGLDSSSILVITQKCLGLRDVATFSAVYGAGQTGDESHYIREFSAEVAHMYFTIPTADSLMRDLSSFVTAHSEPVARTGPYAQFKVMELASQHVKVTLDGQGADEVLAGYHTLYGVYYRELLARGKLATFAREAYHYLDKHRSFNPLLSMIMQWLPRSVQHRVMRASKAYIRPDYWHTFLPHTPVFAQFFSATTLKGALLNMVQHKLEHLLKWGDRNSMWFGVESRVPFLDHRLVERTLATPSREIIRDGMNKLLLRRAMSGLLPEPIRCRKDKIGFGTPEGAWFRDPAYQSLVRDVLHSPFFEQGPHIDTKKAMNLYRRHLAGNINAARDIWKWINLYHWHHTFIANASWKLPKQQALIPAVISGK